MKSKSIVFISLVAIVISIAASFIYVVDEREKAIVFKFREIINSDVQPGLHFRIPVLHEVEYFDARVQTLDAEPEQYLTLEKKNLDVDSFLKWKILDVHKYYTTTKGSKAAANEKLFPLVNNSLREEFGKRTVQEVISGERSIIMDNVRESLNTEASTFGIEILDVRLKRVDLDKDISESVYDRMKAERTRVASELRAQGAEDAEILRADADREREIILANAKRDSEQLRGEGDAIATQTFADAFGQDKEFYRLYRSLNAYRNTFNSKDDLMVLDPSSDFFKYFKNSEQPIN